MSSSPVVYSQVPEDGEGGSVRVAAAAETVLAQGETPAAAQLRAAVHVNAASEPDSLSLCAAAVGGDVSAVASASIGSESTKKQRPTRRPLCIALVALFLLSLTAVFVVVFVDLSRTPSIRLESVRVKAAGRTAVESRSLLLESSLRVSDGPRHAEVELDSAACRVAIRRADTEQPTDLFRFALCQPEAESAQSSAKKIAWSSSLADTPSTTLSLVAGEFDFEALRTLVGEVIVEESSTIQLMQVSCDVSAQLSLFGASLGRWSVSHSFELPVNTSDIRSARASLSDRSQFYHTAAPVGYFALPVPLRLPRHDLFESLESFVVETPLLHRNLLLDFESANTLHQTPAMRFVQSKMPQLGPAGVELVVLPAQLELVSKSPRLSNATIFFSLAPIAAGLSQTAPCVPVVNSSTFAPFSSNSSLNLRMHACQQEQTSPVTRLLGEEHSIEFRPQSKPALADTDTHTYCFGMYVNANAVTDVSACLSLLLVDSPWSESATIQVNVSSLALISVSERLTLDDDTVHFAASSNIEIQGTPLSYAMLELEAAATSAGSSAVHFLESAEPSLAAARISADVAVEYNFAGPYQLDFSSNTSYESAIVSIVGGHMLIDPSSGVVAVTVTESNEASSSTEEVRFSLDFQTRWTDADDILDIHANNTLFLYGAYLSNAQLSASLPLLVDSQNSFTIAVIESANSTLATDNSRVRVAYSGDYSTQDGFLLSVGGATYYEQSLLTEAAVNVHIEDGLVSFDVKEGTPVSSLTQSSSRLSVAYDVAWDSSAGDSFSVHTNGSTWFESECLSTALVSFSFSQSGESWQLAVQESSDPAPITNQTARFDAAYVGLVLPSTFELQLAGRTYVEQSLVTHASLLLQLNSTAAAIQLIESTTVEEPTNDNARLLVDYDTTYRFNSSSSDLLGDLIGRIELQQEIITNLALHLRYADSLLSIAIQEGAVSSLQVDTARVSLGYDAVWSTATGFGVQVTGSTWSSGECLTNGNATFGLVTEPQTFTLAVIESDDPAALTAETARLDAAYDGSWSTVSEFTVQLAGRTYFEQSLVSNADLTFGGDETHGSVVLLESNTSQTLTADTARVQVAYNGSWAADNGFTLDLDGATYYEQALVTSVLVQLEASSSSFVLALTEGPYAALSPIHSRITVATNTQWTLPQSAFTLQSNTSSFFNLECVTNSYFDFAGDANSSTWRVALLESPNGDSLSPATARVDSAYHGTWNFDSDVIGVGVAGRTYLWQDVQSNADFSVSFGTSASQLALLESNTDLPPTTETARIASTYLVTYPEASQLHLSGSTAFEQEVLTNIDASFILAEDYSSASIALLEGAADPLSLNSSRLTATYDADWSTSRGFTLHTNGTTWLQSEILSNALVDLVVDTNQQTYSLAVQESANQSIGADSDRLDATYSGGWKTAPIGAAVAGCILINQQLLHALTFEFEGNATFARARLLESPSVESPTPQTARVVAEYRADFAPSADQVFAFGLIGDTSLNQELLTNATLTVASTDSFASIAVAEGTGPLVTSSARIAADYHLQWNQSSRTFFAQADGATWFQGECLSNGVLTATSVSQSDDADSSLSFGVSLIESPNSTAPTPATARVDAAYSLVITPSSAFNFSASGGGIVSFNQQVLSNSFAAVALNSTSFDFAFLESAAAGTVSVDQARHAAGVQMVLGGAATSGALVPVPFDSAASSSAEFLLASFFKIDYYLYYDFLAYLLLDLGVDARTLDLAQESPYLPLSLWRAVAVTQIPVGVAFHLASADLQTVDLVAAVAAAVEPTPIASSSTGAAESGSSTAGGSSTGGGEWSSSGATAHADSTSSGLSQSAKIGLGVGVSLGGLLILVLLWKWLVWRRIARDSAQRAGRLLYVDSDTPAEYNAI